MLSLTTWLFVVIARTWSLIPNLLHVVDKASKQAFAVYDGGI